MFVLFGLLLVSRFMQCTRAGVVLSARRIFGVLHYLLVSVSPLVRGMRDEKTTVMLGGIFSMYVSAGNKRGSSQ